MRHNILSWATAGAAALLFIAVSPAARATATLTLSDNSGDSITVNDAGSVSGVSGSVSITDTVGVNHVVLTGALGSWAITVNSGLSNPPSGNPLMDLDLTATYNGTGTSNLMTTFTGTGFINFVSFTLSPGGSSNGVTAVSNSASVVGAGVIGTTPLNTAASFTSPGNGGTLQESITVVGATNGAFVSDDFALRGSTVPEPTSILLLGGVLAFAGRSLRKKYQKAA